MLSPAVTGVTGRPLGGDASLTQRPDAPVCRSVRRVCEICCGRVGPRHAILLALLGITKPSAELRRNMVTSGRALLSYETACQALAEVRTKTLAAIKAMFDERATDKTMTAQVAGRMFSQDIVDALAAMRTAPGNSTAARTATSPSPRTGWPVCSSPSRRRTSASVP